MCKDSFLDRHLEIFKVYFYNTYLEKTFLLFFLPRLVNIFVQKINSLKLKNCFSVLSSDNQEIQI